MLTLSMILSCFVLLGVLQARIGVCQVPTNKSSNRLKHRQHIRRGPGSSSELQAPQSLVQHIMGSDSMIKLRDYARNLSEDRQPPSCLPEKPSSTIVTAVLGETVQTWVRRVGFCFSFEKSKFRLRASMLPTLNNDKKQRIDGKLEPWTEDFTTDLGFPPSVFRAVLNMYFRIRHLDKQHRLSQEQDVNELDNQELDCQLSRYSPKDKWNKVRTLDLDKEVYGERDVIQTQRDFLLVATRLREKCFRLVFDVKSNKKETNFQILYKQSPDVVIERLRDKSQDIDYEDMLNIEKIALTALEQEKEQPTSVNPVLSAAKLARDSALNLLEAHVDAFKPEEDMEPKLAKPKEDIFSEADDLLVERTPVPVLEHELEQRREEFRLQKDAPVPEEHRLELAWTEHAISEMVELIGMSDEKLKKEFPFPLARDHGVKKKKKRKLPDAVLDVSQG